VAITGSYTAVSILYFYLLKRHPRQLKYGLFTIVFHGLMLLFMLFVSGFLSVFLAVWIALIISADIAYDSIGLLLSCLTLAATGTLTIVLRPDQSIVEQLQVPQGIALICALGYAIARIRSISEHERIVLVKTREQESFQRERLLALINSMGDAVVTTNENGAIKVYNAAFLSLLDTNENLAGKPIDSVLQLQDQNKLTVSILDDARSIRKVFSRTDLSHKFNEDESMRLYINVAPIRPSYQSHAERGFIFIIRDITKEKTLEEERDEFISVVSHELRTPVAIAEGNLSNIQVLQDRGASPAMLKHAAADAHEQIMYLSKMINDLATLSRAERGINTEGTEEIDPAVLLTELYKTYLSRAEEKHLQLNLDLSPHLPLMRTSRLYLEEILQNFLTNAIKYTKEGSVTLVGHNTNEGVYIAVKDTGIGISKSDQRHIFEKFYRSEDYRTRESSGTGLGLYITKKLAEKMNITIRFESRLNHGSTFSLVVASTLHQTAKKPRE